MLKKLNSIKQNIIKKLLLFSVIMTATFFSSATLYADCGTGCADGLICYQDQCVEQIDILTQGLDQNQKPSSPEIEVYEQLPDVSGEDLVASIIKTILGWTMILTIAAIVVAGFFYVISGGEDDDITTSKNILKYLIIGVLIEAGAYGIVAGIIQFDFFK